MTSAPRPPIGDTLQGGAYRVIEKLLEGGAQTLCLGESTANPEERVLITTILVFNGLNVSEVSRSLSYQAPGIFRQACVSFFDIQGDDLDRHIYQEQHAALIENLPPGEWLPRLTAAALDAPAAVVLGSSVGHLLLRAAEEKILVLEARPEYIWASRGTEGSLRAMGLSDRYGTFLKHTDGGCLIPALLFQRTYLAPEIHRGKQGSATSLTFSLATMIAEWATGQYPFPDSRYKGSLPDLLKGDHIPLEVPAPLAQLLHRGLQADPAERPPLAKFLAELESLKLEPATR
jgi:hypothetical protein